MSAPKRSLPRLPWYTLFIVFALWVICWLAVVNWCTTDYRNRWAIRGQFGDMFGAVNALFSGLAFAGLIITITQQNRALQLQQDEIIENGNIIKRQIFDNTFFSMLSMHNDLVNSIDLRDSRTKILTVEGKDCFEVFFTRLEKEINSYISKSVEATQIVKEDIVKGMEIGKYIELYEAFYKKNQKNLGHYYRNLYSLVSMVDNSALDDDSKYQYVKIVRAQLSMYELMLLFYNCLSIGKDKFKPLVEKYALLKHINKGGLFKSNHIELYPATAYVRVSKKSATA